MSGSHTTRRIYSAEELRRLRGSCSAPKLSEAIEENGIEDAELVKEHVLRGSRSFAARSFRSRHASSVLRHPLNNENVSSGLTEHPPHPSAFSTRPALSEIANNNQVARAIPGRLRPSPTPSLKRKKAEAIVKAHGSPTHVRVTAGGRIVPSEQSPLCFPRFGYSAIKSNGGLIKFAPNHQSGNATQWTQTAQDGSQNGFVAQDTEGRLCQIVNGTIMPLTEVNGALHLYMPAPNLNITQRGLSGNLQESDVTQLERGATSQASVPTSVQPSLEAQMTALGLEYARLERELKDLDKTEVIHGKSMGKSAKDALVAKRRELIITMDRIRKAIKALKERPVDCNIERPQTPKMGARSDRSSLSPSISVDPSFAHHSRQIIAGSNSVAFPQQPGSFYPMAPFMPAQPVFGHINGESGFLPPPFMIPPMGFFMNPPPFDGPVGWAPPYQSYPDSADTAMKPVVPTVTSSEEQHPTETPFPQNDGASSTVEFRSTSPRENHTLTLRDPDTKQVINVKSLLNPMSPVYKPSVDGANRSEHNPDMDQKAINRRVPTPLSFTRLTLAERESATRVADHGTTISSGSSIRTMDFFPQNARDHSTRKHEYPQVLAGHQQESSAGGQSSAQASTAHTSDRLDLSQHDVEWKPVSSKNGEFKVRDVTAPKAPPGTPVVYTNHDRGLDTRSSTGHQHGHFSIGSRKPSPQESQIILEQAEQQQQHSSLETVPVLTINFSNKPRAWVEGYQAGLQHKSIGADCMGDFLDGYCSGILKSQLAGPTENDSKPQTHTNTARDYSAQNTDPLKQAVFAPSNENAVLSPAIDGPAVSDNHYNLGSWQKQHDSLMSASGQGLGGFPFPDRTSSMADSVYHSEGDAVAFARNRQHSIDSAFGRIRSGDQPPSSNSEKSSLDAANAKSCADDAKKAATVESSKQRKNVSGHGKRIISPLEWRTRNSLANVANMTTGFFAHTQVDGQPLEKQPSQSDEQPMLSAASRIAGSIYTREGGSRFKEASLDGLSPPMSPEPAMSPPLSPRSSPAKMFRDRRSPSKIHSPTKAKLEQIASKVGIKASPEKSNMAQEYGSPQSKHRWKDIWKGTRSVSGKHDTA